MSKIISIELPTELLNKFTTYSKLSGCSVNEFIVGVIERYVSLEEAADDSTI
jgi:metal-responsive CopG/Arc/MetJ family transcriptional regulator